MRLYFCVYCITLSIIFDILNVVFHQSYVLLSVGGTVELPNNIADSPSQKQRNHDSISSPAHPINAQSFQMRLCCKGEQADMFKDKTKFWLLSSHILSSETRPN